MKKTSPRFCRSPVWFVFNALSPQPSYATPGKRLYHRVGINEVPLLAASVRSYLEAPRWYDRWHTDERRAEQHP